MISSFSEFGEQEQRRMRMGALARQSEVRTDGCRPYEEVPGIPQTSNVVIEEV
jgi:hypothetical protein